MNVCECACVSSRVSLAYIVLYLNGTVSTHDIFPKLEAIQDKQEIRSNSKASCISEQRVVSMVTVLM